MLGTLKQWKKNNILICNDYQWIIVNLYKKSFISLQTLYFFEMLIGLLCLFFC